MNDGDSNFDAPPPEESSNRTFLIAAGVLGGIVLLSIACLAGYALLILPRQSAANQQAATAQAVQNLQVAQALTATSQALSVPTGTVNGTVQGITQGTDSSGHPIFTVVLLKADGTTQSETLEASDAVKLGLVTKNADGSYSINSVVGKSVSIPTGTVNGTVQGITESTDASGNPVFNVVILKTDGTTEIVRLGAPDAVKLGLVTKNADGTYKINSVVGTGVSIPTAIVALAPTQTPVVAQATATAIPSTNTPDPATATVGAALTQAAQAQLTHIPTSTALPGTGIADQYGAPGLVILGMALIAVIFLARRLRVGSAK